MGVFVVYECGYCGRLGCLLCRGWQNLSLRCSVSIKLRIGKLAL